ncbi:MAG: RNA polymerase sigma factor [Clostridia bacterium]|nr:RNA polymerase sigma factor [Clostridia bacterium]
MEDERIVSLYFDRSEQAIAETQKKYGRYCRTIARNILADEGEAEECENDTYLHTWCTIPPARPRFLRAFLGKITRNLALDRYAARVTDKRNGTLVAISDELAACLPDLTSPDVGEGLALRESLNRFLSHLPARTRILFVRRYFYLLPVREIAEGLGIGESYAKVLLHRTRNALRIFLKKDGFHV